MATMMDIFIHTAMKQMHTTHTLYWKSLTFPAHTCTLFLLCSALHGLGLLSGAITSSTGGEGPLILLPLFAILSTLLLENKGMSQAQGGTEQVITFCELQHDHTHARARTQTHTHTKEKTPPEISSNGSIRCEKRNTAVLYYYW